MAARENLSHIQRTRDKIQGGMLVTRLIDHALGKIEMTDSQIKAAQILLKKTIPDLKAVEAEVHVSGGLQIGWQDSHSIQSEAITSQPSQDADKV